MHHQQTFGNFSYDYLREEQNHSDGENFSGYFCLTHTNSTHSAVALPVRDSWILYTGLILAIEITIVNSILLFLFCKQRTSSPITILLGSLAFSDTASAILRFVPKFIAYTVYSDDLIKCEVNGYSYFWLVPFHTCKISIWIELIGSIIFHETSNFITTILCVERAIILKYPIKSRHYLNKKVTAFSIGLGFLVSCSYNLPHWIATLSMVYTSNEDGMCIVNHSNFTSKYYKLEQIMMKTCSFVYAATLVVILFCTLYISSKLTCFRNNSIQMENLKLQKRNKRGGLLVIIICVIFVLSETLNYMYHFLYLLGKQCERLYEFSNRYRHLLMELGFSMNFVVYMIMNKQFRDLLMTYIKRVFRCGGKKPIEIAHLTKTSTFFKL